MKQSKINILSESVQWELNGRIENNEAGADILKWLNGLPEVKQVLDRHFGGIATFEDTIHVVGGPSEEAKCFGPVAH